MIAITIGLGGLIYWCGRRLFNARAGVLAVTLFSLEPTIQAHGWIVHTDIPASTAYLGWWAALTVYATRPSWRRAIVLGLVSGAAVATKYNLLVLLPLGVLALAILWLVAPRRGDKRAADYRAWRAHRRADPARRQRRLFLRPPTADRYRHQLAPRRKIPARADLVLTIMRVLSPIVPPYYQLGTYTVLTHNADGHPAGLLGEFSSQGWWYYFPVAFALKTALPILVLTLVGARLGVSGDVAAGAGLALRSCSSCRSLIFAASTMSSHINIGVRHFLPVFPFCFLLGGALLDRLLGSPRPGTAEPAKLLTPQLLIGPAIVALPPRLAGGRVGARLPERPHLHEPTRQRRTTLVLPLGLECRVGPGCRGARRIPARNRARQRCARRSPRRKRSAISASPRSTSSPRKLPAPRRPVISRSARASSMARSSM